MVKSVLGVSHEGLKQWKAQRASAIILGLYSLCLIFYLIFYSPLSFAEWHYLFSLAWMKVATLLFLLALIYHAWIGIWTVLTDYVKPFLLRLILNSLVLLMLAICFIWGLLIVWSV